jgi:hypothetical protein
MGSEEGVVELLQNISSNSFTKWLDAIGRSVAMVTIPNCLHCSLTDVGWGWKIRLADTEIDDVLARGCQLSSTSQNSEGILCAQGCHVGSQNWGLGKSYC